ncbi:MAG: SDR family NAD(P)-dependent oxidoreductase [Dehalococcoidia bacterium]
MRLNGKVALIAGAGGRQGTAVALVFAREGARVVLAGLDDGEVKALAARINEPGGEAVAEGLDLSTPEGAKRAVELARSAFGRVDILYNNSGGYLDGLLHETAEADWDRVMTQNVRSHYLTARFAIPLMLGAGGGSIINVGAARAARQGGNAAYAASKGAVIAMTQNMARAYRDNNIRVNCICPTNIGSSPDQFAAPLPPTTLVRDGTPEDVAYLALYLASDEAAWVTGVAFVVDGGAEVLS